MCAHKQLLLRGVMTVSAVLLTTCSSPDAPVRPPEIHVSTGALTFAAPSGADPAAQSISITNSGGGTLNWSATDDATWLTLLPSSGTGAGSISAVVSTNGLSVGTYSATITVMATGATSVSIGVSLTVALPPTIALSPTSLSFSAIAGGANPASQSVSLSNTGGSTLAWTASSNAAWLAVASTSGTAPSTLTVSATTGSLAAGTYTGAITVTGTAATNTPQTVSVTFTVAPPPAIGLSATSLSFSGNTGGSNPASQTFDVTNTGGGALSWTATDDASWLTVSPTSGGVPSTVTASVNTTGLAAGNYSGTITISATGVSNSPRTVAVTLTMTTPDYNGSWSGKTSQADSTITMTISGNGITQISFGWSVPNCSTTGRITTNYTTAVDVTSGSFSRTISSSPLSYTITGTFSGPKAVAGTLTLNFSMSFPFSCSSTVSGVTWSATRP